MNRLAIMLLTLLIAGIAHAQETVYYLQMMQILTNWNETPVYAQIVVSNEAEAVTLMHTLADDPDYFGDSGDGELSWVASYHTHHFHPDTPCTNPQIGVHFSNKKGMSQWVLIAEDPEEAVARTGMRTVYMLRCKNQGQANALEKKIAKQHPGKKWKLKKHGW